MTGPGSNREKPCCGAWLRKGDEKNQLGVGKTSVTDLDRRAARQSSIPWQQVLRGDECVSLSAAAACGNIGVAHPICLLVVSEVSVIIQTRRGKEIWKPPLGYVIFAGWHQER